MSNAIESGICSGLILLGPEVDLRINASCLLSESENHSERAMARRISSSQIRSMLRQQQNKINQALRRAKQEADRIDRANKAALDKYVRDVNREIDRVNNNNKRILSDRNRKAREINQNYRRAVSRYNQLIRAHNAQVEQERHRRLAALKAMSTTRYVEVKNSTFELSNQFGRVEHIARSSTAHADLLDLSQREVANSATLAVALNSDERLDEVERVEDTGVIEYLAGFSDDLCDRWRGALHALSPTNPDAARHFCISVREIFTEILNQWADDDDVAADDPFCDRTQQGTPSRRAKIRYLLRRKGADSPEMLGFVDSDIEDILQLFPVFNKAAHGAAGMLNFVSLKALRKRVEGGIMFLAAIGL